MSANIPAHQGYAPTATMLPAEGQVVTTTSTVTESTVRGRRIRLFITGFLQLIFGGFSLIPVLLLAQNPVTITACAWLSLTGMVGILGACVSSNKTSTSVKYDAVTRTQRVVTVPPMFPRFYVGMMVVGFIIAVASAIVGIVQITTHESWSGYILLGAFAVGFGLFFVLNQMLMICCVSPMVRVHTASSEQVHIVSGSAPVPAAAGAYGAYQPTSQVPYHVGDPGLPPQTNEALYPYIDEPTKDYPPSYSEAIRDSYPQKQPSAPAL